MYVSYRSRPSSLPLWLILDFWLIFFSFLLSWLIFRWLRSFLELYYPELTQNYRIWVHYTFVLRRPWSFQLRPPFKSLVSSASSIVLDSLLQYPCYRPYLHVPDLDLWSFSLPCIVASGASPSPAGLSLWPLVPIHRWRLLWSLFQPISLLQVNSAKYGSDYSTW